MQMINGPIACDPMALIRAWHDDKLGMERMVQSVRALGGLLFGHAVSSEAMTAIDTIARGCEHMLSGYHERLALCPGRADLCDIVRGAVALYAPCARAGGVKLCHRIDERAIWMRVDRRLLIRALNNLIANAIRHAPNGGAVDISIRRRARHVFIGVRDNGQGIAPALVPHLFDMGSKSDSSQGWGVGLSNAAWIMGMHGGEVRCLSKVGAGTLMILKIPNALLCEPDPFPADEADPVGQGLALAEPCNAIISNLDVRHSLPKPHTNL